MLMATPTTDHSYVDFSDEAEEVEVENSTEATVSGVLKLSLLRAAVVVAKTDGTALWLRAGVGPYQ